MPIPEIESLTKDSGQSQVQAAISSCIATEIRNGRDPEQAKAMCHEMARKKSGGEPASSEGSEQ